MLQQGELVTDVCYFIGEGKPAYLGLRSELEPSIPPGYDYDGIDYKNLQNLVVKNGKIVLPGVGSWSILVIRDYERITPELLSTLIGFVQNGATVYMGKPEKSPSLIDFDDSDGNIKALANKVWNNPKNSTEQTLIKFGKGNIFFNYSITDILSEKGVIPDFSYNVSDADNELKYIHRKSTDQDIYFVSNGTSNKFKATLKFRQKNKFPVVLNPVDGSYYSVPFSENSNSAEIELAFNKYDSYFVVFENSRSVKKLPNYTLVNSVFFDNPWQLSFLNNKALDTALIELTDWSRFDHNEIKYYSGVVEYSNNIKIKPKKNHRYTITIDRVHNIVEVSVNSNLVANLWRAPYSVDITRHIVSGDNTITFKVVNTAINQMIGDERYPTDIDYYEWGSIKEFPEWLINTNINRDSERKSFVTWKYQYSDKDLQPSGIIGNVKIVVERATK
jgi:hypothetical protein